MIKEQYVSFETAKLLKEKGFNEECYAWYTADNKWHFTKGLNDYHFNSLPDIPAVTNPKKERISRPTLQMAMKWLREVHNVHIDSSIYIDTDGDSEHEYSYTYWDWRVFNSECGSLIAEPALGCSRYDSYEQACEAAIKYCLKNLI